MQLSLYENNHVFLGFVVHLKVSNYIFLPISAGSKINANIQGIVLR